MRVIITRDRLRNVCNPGQHAFVKDFPKHLIVNDWTDYHQGLLLSHPVWKTFWGFAARKHIIPRLPITELYLEGVDFEGADLCYADFSGSMLRKANFRGANLYKTVFCYCDLSYADFTGANVKFANFAGAKIDGADFTDVERNVRDPRFQK